MIRSVVQGAVLVAVSAALLALSCSAASAAVLVPGCANPTDSAMNQYCEVVPGASGATPPSPETPLLAGALPARTVRRIARQPTQRALLALPAPARPLRASNSAGLSQTAGDVQTAPSGSSLPEWLFLLLAASALMLIAAAVVGRRRRGGAGGAPA